MSSVSAEYPSQRGCGQSLQSYSRISREHALQRIPVDQEGTRDGTRRDAPAVFYLTDHLTPLLVATS